MNIDLDFFYYSVLSTLDLIACQDLSTFDYEIIYQHACLKVKLILKTLRKW